MDRFGSGHTAPSTHVVGGSSYTLPRTNSGVHVHRNGPIHVNIGSTSYTPSYVPSSTTPVPSNAFLISHHPHSSHGPSGRSTTSSHVFPSYSHVVVLQGYMPPYMSKGYVPPYVSGGNLLISPTIMAM